MVKLFFDAVVFGLTLALVFGFGPVFFTLLQTSIDRGFRSAAWLALGVMTCDLIIVSLCVLTSIRLVTENDREMFLFSLVAREIVMDACGSVSTSRTLLPSCARAAPRLMQLVLLATPPFWFTSAVTVGAISIPPP